MSTGVIGGGMLWGCLRLRHSRKRPKTAASLRSKRHGYAYDTPVSLHLNHIVSTRHSPPWPQECNHDDRRGHYYGYRYYLPEVGRWVSGELDDEEVLNPYLFSLSDVDVLVDADAVILSTGLGSTECDLTKPPDSPMQKKNKDKACSKACTQEHEDQHEADLKPCCKKARAAYQAKGANKKKLAKAWKAYEKAARPWTECNAYKVSLKCADKALNDWDCDCPPSVAVLQDCNCMRTYKLSTKSQITKFCGQKGAGNAPACPF